MYYTLVMIEWLHYIFLLGWVNSVWKNVKWIRFNRIKVFRCYLRSQTSEQNFLWEILHKFFWGFLWIKKKVFKNFLRVFFCSNFFPKKILFIWFFLRGLLHKFRKGIPFKEHPGVTAEIHLDMSLGNFSRDFIRNSIKIPSENLSDILLRNFQGRF